VAATRTTQTCVSPDHARANHQGVLLFGWPARSTSQASRVNPSLCFTDQPRPCSCTGDSGEADAVVSHHPSPSQSLSRRPVVLVLLQGGESAYTLPACIVPPLPSRILCSTDQPRLCSCADNSSQTDTAAGPLKTLV